MTPSNVSIMDINVTVILSLNKKARSLNLFWIFSDPQCWKYAHRLKYTHALTVNPTRPRPMNFLLVIYISWWFLFASTLWIHQDSDQWESVQTWEGTAGSHSSTCNLRTRPPSRKAWTTWNFLLPNSDQTEVTVCGWDKTAAPPWAWFLLKGTSSFPPSPRWLLSDCWDFLCVTVGSS